VAATTTAMTTMTTKTGAATTTTTMTTTTMVDHAVDGMATIRQGTAAAMAVVMRGA